MCGDFHWLGYNLIRNSMIFLYCDHTLILSEVFAFRQVIEALSKWNMPELLCWFGLYVLCILSQTTKISKDFIGRSYSMNSFLKLVCGYTKYYSLIRYYMNYYISGILYTNP